ncbi:MAG: branched-chain amino acid ABC transporter permease [Deltaproteobacteria bacterium]
MTFFLKLTATGILTGSIYALIAMGIVLIYKATRVFNFAQGEVVVIGGLMTTTFMGLFGILPGIIAGIVASFGMGLLIERTTLRPLIGQPILATIMMTLGLSWVLRGVGTIGWQSTIRQMPQVMPKGQVVIGSLSISEEYLIAFSVSILVFVVFALFFQMTKLGLGMRATAENHQYAQSTGINVKGVFAITWATSCMTACMGAILLGAIGGGISPTISAVGLKAFPAVIVGGLESLPGAIIGGMIIGLLEAWAGGLIHPSLIEITPYIVLLLVLFIRPYGIFGLVRIERV